MKKLFSVTGIGFFAGALLFVGVSTAQAATLTAVQIQAVVQLLQSFNVDPSTVAYVSQTLSGSVSGPMPVPVPSPVPQSPACLHLSEALMMGATDARTQGQVSMLQHYLGIAPTGYFGPLTQHALAQFQYNNGIPAVGIVGPVTRAALARLCTGNPTPTPQPITTTFTLGTPFSVATGQMVTEAQLGQLTVRVSSVGLSTAQVTLGLNCVRGTQCFYYPQQTLSMMSGQQVEFEGYTLTLESVGNLGATFTATASSTAVQITPTISTITPVEAPVGTQITITGNGFTADNTVHFGAGGSAHVPSSNNGTTITYTIPQSIGPCDLVTAGQQICAAALMLVTPGTYNVSVSNENGQSSAISFTVTGSQPVPTTFSVTAPVAGQSFTRGQAMTISWSASSAVPSSASVILNLYTSANAKVGTIAIPASSTGSFVWHIPRYPQTYMCTMIFPNGLCGVSIPTGQYYVTATAVSDGFSPTATQYGTAQSGLFTILQS